MPADARVRKQHLNYSDTTLIIGTNVDGAPIVVNLIGQVCDPMDCDFLTRFLADHEQPKWLEFPPQPIGGSAGPLALKTFAYEGHVGSTFNARLSGGDADSFEITSTSCSGEERPDCAFEIVFRPRKEGPLATELVIYRLFAKFEDEQVGVFYSKIRVEFGTTGGGV